MGGTTKQSVPASPAHSDSCAFSACFLWIRVQYWANRQNHVTTPDTATHCPGLHNRIYCKLSVIVFLTVEPAVIFLLFRESRRPRCLAKVACSLPRQMLRLFRRLFIRRSFSGENSCCCQDVKSVDAPCQNINYFDCVMAPKTHLLRCLCFSLNHPTRFQ